MFETYLQEIGLSDKEATVYLSLLTVEHSSVMEIAQKTKIKRPTVYVVLQTLAKKGLVSETEAGKKTRYYAEPPERLETYIERQKVALSEHQKHLKEIIPQIKSIERRSGERPVVKFFEGLAGVVGASEELLSDTGETGGIAYLVYPKDRIDKLFTEEEREKLRHIRIGKNIRSKVLYTVEHSAAPVDTTGDRRQIDTKEYPLTCDISIYNDKIRFAILGEKISGILIRSKDLAETLRSVFELAFERAGEKKIPRP